MILLDWLQFGFFFLILCLLTKPVGLHLYRIFEHPYHFLFLKHLEDKIFKFCGIQKEEQDWKTYAYSLLSFNIIGLIILFLIQISQFYLPFNPQQCLGVPWELALNTAVSFVTNTNWQAYSGETTMSYFTQMMGLTWQNFCSASTGIAAFLALARGLRHANSSSGPSGLGNYWVDLVRSILYVFLPACFLFALILVSQGVIQNFLPSLKIMTLEGEKQFLAMGPVASQEAIKILGTNGGGFFNANSSHPFENPTPLTNILQMLAFVLIPAALTYTYGKIVKNQFHSWSLFSVMIFLAVLSAVLVYYFESQPNPLFNSLPLDQDLGNFEGKEVRFGIAGSSLFASLTTQTSCGAVNSMHESFTPLGGMVLLVNMLLGEVVFGGVGMGLFGMVIFVIITVFIAGLMVGRTPEYLGKKIEVKEIRLAILYVALYPLVILIGAAWSLLAPYALSSLLNSGPHGLTEILYAYTSAAENNGSAFAGLNANTPWYTLSLSLVMLMGRFCPIFLGLAIAGSMVNKKTLTPSSGTFPTQGGFFISLLTGVILIVGALAFFPVLTLGPLSEYFFSLQGKSF